MRILITGIAGLIGSNFAKYILNNTNDTVIGIDDLSCGLELNVPQTVWYETCIDGSGICDSIFRDEQPDVVYHFAAYAAECLSPFIRCYNYLNNIVATAEVITMCIKYNVKRLVFTSSMAVYGEANPPFNEAFPCKPIDPYGIAKYACEQDIQVAGKQHKLDWCILRPHNVYGPGQIINQKYRNVFGIWMYNYLNDLPLLIYGNGEQKRAFTYIDDILPALHAAGISEAASRQIINIGGQTPITINQAAKVLQYVLGGGNIEYREARHEVFKAWCSTAKSMKFLGYENETPLQIGLKNMWEWVKETECSEQILPQIELEEGLPEYWR